jgi:hypothetical protein
MQLNAEKELLGPPILWEGYGSQRGTYIYTQYLYEYINI